MTSRVPVVCEARKDDLAALALGELPGDREAALRSHVETCPGCRAYHAAMARTLGAVRALPQPEPSEALTARILAAARQSHREALVPTTGLVARWLEQLAAAFRRPLLSAAVVAVAVASAAVALLVLGRDDASSPTVGTSGPQLARFEAPTAEPAAPVAVGAPAAPPEGRADDKGAAESLRARGPDPSAPEAVALALPNERRAEDEDDVQVEEAPAEELESELQRAMSPEVSGAVRGGGQAVTRQAAGAAAASPSAPPPVAPPADVDSGERFTPGREVVAGEGDVIVGGRTPAAEPDAAGGGGRAEAQAPAAAQTVATGTASTPALAAAFESEPATVADYMSTSGGGATAVAAPPPPPVAPAMPAAAPGSAEQAYPGSTSVATESIARFAAPTVDEPAAAPADGYGGFAGADDANDTQDQRERDAAAATDRVSVARRQLADGEAAAAEELLEQALREETARAADVTFLLAETYARQGKWSDAARTYELFLARHLDDPRADEARWRGADAYRRAGNETRSAALLRQLVGVPGYDDRARTALGELATAPADAAGGPAAASFAADAPAEAMPATVAPADPP